MVPIQEEELKKIIPTDGPSISEVKSYLKNIMMNISLLNVVVVFL